MRGLRKQLRAAERLGAISVRVFRGRGRARRITFPDGTWTAPNREMLAFMDCRDRDGRLGSVADRLGRLAAAQGRGAEGEVCRTGTASP
jgi:hypothetical protein